MLGGLIQDSQRIICRAKACRGSPRLPLIGDVFSYRDDTVKKIELVIFTKPVAVKDDWASR